MLLVLLILLVVFMVTVPLLTQAVKVELPETVIKTAIPSENHVVTISIDVQGNISLNDTPKALTTQKEKEQALCAEIDKLIGKAKRCDHEEDKACQEKTGYEIPQDLPFKQDRLAKIKAAKQALEAREENLNPGKTIDHKKQISFADTEARIMGKGKSFDYAYNAQISVDADWQIIVGQHISPNANDKQQVEPALQALQETTGRLPDKLSADNG